MSTVLAVIDLRARVVLGSGYPDVRQARAALNRVRGDGVTLVAVPTWALVDIGTWIDEWMAGAADRYLSARMPTGSDSPTRDARWDDPPLIREVGRRSSPAEMAEVAS